MPVRGLDLQTRRDEFSMVLFVLGERRRDVNCDVDEALDEQAPCNGFPPLKEGTRLLGRRSLLRELAMYPKLLLQLSERDRSERQARRSKKIVINVVDDGMMPELGDSCRALVESIPSRYGRGESERFSWTSSSLFDDRSEPLDDSFDVDDTM